MGDMILAADAIDPRARVKPADPEVPQDPAAPEPPDVPEAPDAGAPEVLTPAPLPGGQGIDPGAVSAVDSASLTAPV
jgi:hypothetical protein